MLHRALFFDGLCTSIGIFDLALLEYTSDLILLRLASPAVVAIFTHSISSWPNCSPSV